MRVITWNKSFKGLPNQDDVKDEFDSEENETHATVLDKMLAWEKKLYDEVKVCGIGHFNHFSFVESLKFLPFQYRRRCRRKVTVGEFFRIINLYAILHK